MRTAKTLRETLTRRSALLSALLGCVLWIGAASMPNAGLLDEEQVGDTPAYERTGEAVLAGELPYRDFYLEYPPGALPVFVLPAIGSGDGYAWRFKLLMLVLGLALVVSVVAALSAAGAAPQRIAAASVLVGVAPVALGPVVLVNYDVWPTLLATGAVAALTVRRSAAAGALLGCGFVAKVFPIVLLPIALLHLRATSGRPAAVRCLAAFAAAAAALAGPFAVLAPGAIGFDLTVAVRRPLQIESLGSSLLLAAHQLGLYGGSVNSDYNSQNLGGDLAGAFATVGSLLAAVVVAAILLVYRRRAGDLQTLFLAAAAAVVTLVAFGKVLSPQYLVWIVPLVALSGLAVASLLTLGALVLTQLWFPSRYGDLVRLGDVAWIVLARNLVLVVLVVALVVRLRRVPSAS